jgi:hypothetical protein
LGSFCGPFSPTAAVLLRSPNAGNSQGHARTASHEPQCFRVFRRRFMGSEPMTFHRGVRFKLAFLSRFAPCGPFAVPIPGVCHRVRVYVGRRVARTARERGRRQSTMVLRVPPFSRRRQTGGGRPPTAPIRMGSSGSSAQRLRRLCDGAPLPRYVVMLCLPVDVDLRVLPGNADRATPRPRRTHRHFNSRDSAHRNQPLGDK